MALVVLLRGANVGGRRAFRPSILARELKDLGAINIGAADTFVIRQQVARSELRAELAERLPFETEIMICEGREIVRLMSKDIFAPHPAPPSIVRFVSVLSRLPSLTPRLPMTLPSRGQWLLQVLARDGRFVIGDYRRHMKAINYLDALDRIFGAPATTLKTGIP